MMSEEIILEEAINCLKTLQSLIGLLNQKNRKKLMDLWSCKK